MSEVRGDNLAAVDFLRWLRPAGPWVLTAIPPDGGATITETFTELAKALDWIAAYNGRQNLYFMVNSARGPLRSKAKKEDVEAMDFLHVDVDPAKGVDPALDRPRILERLKAFRPAPSAIIDSGGGYQGFWRLDEALFIGGDPVRWGDAEAYNQQIEVVLGGDHCHNCDRIMRIPGTVNLPNEKKRRAGRVARTAAVVEMTSAAYSLAEFTPAAKVQIASSPTTAQVKLNGNLEPVDLEKLPPEVHPRAKMLIVQGDDPDEPGKYSSRSDVVFAVCCYLIRGGVDDNTIASILLDKDFAVSGHIYDQKRPIEYAARQIQRAREEVEDPMLRQLNEKHAVIADYGGKCLVVSEILDVTLKRPRSRLSAQSFENFRNRYMHIKVEIGRDKNGPKYAPAGHWWLQHPMRRQYDTIVFAPRGEVPGAYNLWQGFACEAIPGDKHELFLQHVRDNICNGNLDHYNYLIGWMARTVQYPAEQGEVAVVLRGGQGAGKGTFINGFGSLFGRHYMQVSNAKHLTGQFNGHLQDCIVLFADEAFFAGDKQHESVLKTMITEDTLNIEKKHVDVVAMPNYVHMLASGNGDWLVPAGMDERRFLVMDVSEERKQDKAYFAAIRRAMDAGGREALLHFLMTYDIKDFDVRTPPQTEALKEQKMYTLSAEANWWLDCLTNGRTVAGSPGWKTPLPKDQLMGDYLRYCEAQRIFRRVSPTALGKFLNKMLKGTKPELDSYQQTVDVEKFDETGMPYKERARVYFYALPPLDQARAAWDRLYGTWAWPKERDGTSVPELPLAEDPY